MSNLAIEIEPSEEIKSSIFSGINQQTKNESSWILGAFPDLFFIFSSFWIVGLVFYKSIILKDTYFGWDRTLIWISAAHLIAPLILFWSDSKLRSAVKKSPIKYKVQPILFLFLPIAFGFVALSVSGSLQIQIVNFLALNIVVCSHFLE
jgi:hypothetical protein